MALDSLTEAGRPHMEAEQRVADALCEVYHLDAEKSDDPNCHIDRVFYPRMKFNWCYRRGDSGEHELHAYTPEEVEEQKAQRKPSSVVEVKHRNRGRYGDVRSFRRHGSDYDNGYMIDTDKIDNGIAASDALGVPFFVVVALDGPTNPPEGFVVGETDTWGDVNNVIVAWQITAPTADGSMTTNIVRLCGERETQSTVNGGRKIARVDYLPCPDMLILRDATKEYRRMLA